MTVSISEIIGAAGVDPREPHAHLMAGQPEQMVTLARAFEEAGQVAQDAYSHGRRAHGEIAAAYTTNGVPVLDAAEADHGAWRLLGQGGLDMEHTAALVKRSVGALDQAQSSSTAAIDRMTTQLDTLVSRWSSAVQASGGVFTPADREQAIAAGVGIVRAAATEVDRAVDAYDSSLLGGAADLVERGYGDGDGAVESAVRGFVQKLQESGGDWLGVLGAGGGAVAAALAAKDSWKVISKSTALLRFLDSSSKPITDYDTFLRNMKAADTALAEFKAGKANGGALRFVTGSRAAGIAGKAFLPLTVATGAMDAVTGGGYDGARGWATRGFGAAGAIGAGTLLASSAGLVALGPVGLGVAGAAVLGYGAWSAGNFIWDHREQIGEFAGNAAEWTGDRLSDAKDWADDRLSDAGEAIQDVGKKAVSTLSFGLFG